MNYLRLKSLLESSFASLTEFVSFLVEDREGKLILRVIGNSRQKYLVSLPKALLILFPHPNVTQKMRHFKMKIKDILKRKNRSSLIACRVFIESSYFEESSIFGMSSCSHCFKLWSSGYNLQKLGKFYSFLYIFYHTGQLPKPIPN